MTHRRESSQHRSRRRTLPVWAVALVGFAFGFAISGWVGGGIGLGFVLLVSRLL